LGVVLPSVVGKYVPKTGIQSIMKTFVPRDQPMIRCKIVAYLFFALFSLSCQVLADIPENIKAIYLPPHTVTNRHIDQFLFYAEQVDLNAVVLHVKDPFGRLNWSSDNPLARSSGASSARGLESRIRQLKADGIWTIAKLDVFGLTAWKHDDFGVGQILEKMAPHLDIICPCSIRPTFPPVS
jgi:hypothetical protein